VARTVAHSRQSEERRHHTRELVTCLIAAAAMAGLILWERQLGLPRDAVRGAAFAMAGVASLVGALSGRARRVYAAGAVALIPLGLALPLCRGPQVALAGGVAMMAAGLCAAGIMAWQLRAEEGGRERAAD